MDTRDQPQAAMTANPSTYLPCIMTSPHWRGDLAIWELTQVRKVPWFRAHSAMLVCVFEYGQHLHPNGVCQQKSGRRQT